MGWLILIIASLLSWWFFYAQISLLFQYRVLASFLMAWLVPFAFAIGYYWQNFLSPSAPKLRDTEERLIRKSVNKLQVIWNHNPYDRGNIAVIYYLFYQITFLSPNATDEQINEAVIQAVELAAKASARSSAQQALSKLKPRERPR